MNAGEILRQPRQAAISYIRGLMAAIETRHYGSPEQRQEAYAILRSRFEQFFTDNPKKIGTLKSDSNTRRLSFDWTRKGSGCLDEKDGAYIFHVSSYPYNRADSVWGDKVNVKQNILYLSGEGAMTLEYVETRITPPTERPFPIVTTSRVKTELLGAQTALGLVEELGMPAFKPTTDSWLADYTADN